MNNPQSTIDDFASRLTDLSLLTPLHTHRPKYAYKALPTPPMPLNKPVTLSTLLNSIVKGISTNGLPLDPTLPILQTPDKIPLKHLRPSIEPRALLPDVESIVTLPEGVQHDHSSSPMLFPGDDPFAPYFQAQKHHLERVSHYNFKTLEITPSKSIEHSTQDFLEEVMSLLDHDEKFRNRFGCQVRSLETVALLSAHKPSREAVVPIGQTVFVHTRYGGKIRTRNDGVLERITSAVALDRENIWYRRVSGMVFFAWFICILFIGAMTGVLVWVLKGGVIINALAVLHMLFLLLILFLGAGKEFRDSIVVLLGWRMWVKERDVVRDVSVEGRDALVAGLFYGDSVDEFVSAFGVGCGVSLREWGYDPRYGLFVGERSAFMVRGRRWFRVVKEVCGKNSRYTLFPSAKRKAFVGVPAGVRVVDGGREREIV